MPPPPSSGTRTPPRHTPPRLTPQDNIVTIAKYRAQAERLEKELRELLQGRQPLDAHAVPTEEATAAAGGGQQQGGTGGGDAPMAEVAGQPQQQQQQQQQPNSGGMWM